MTQNAINNTASEMDIGNIHIETDQIESTNILGFFIGANEGVRLETDLSFNFFGGFVYTVTAIDNTDTPYTALSTDSYISVDASTSAITVRLPNAPLKGRVFMVKDSTGSAETNNITVTTVGGVVTIDGSTSYVINTNYNSNSFIFNGTSYEVF
jgi:hypothetical protein